MLMATAPESIKAETNVATSCINWEGQHIWLISAYFPNSLEETKVTIKSLRAILNTLKTKRVILAGNSTLQKPCHHLIQEVYCPYHRLRIGMQKPSKRSSMIGNLRTCRLRNPMSNEKLKGKPGWVSIDRVYANFRIEADVTVSIYYHPGLDHRGVLYSWSHRGHIDTSSSQQATTA
jgi:hypothetical protein